MIIFLNGALGVGESAAAELLVERIPGATVYDPEAVGAFVWHLSRDMDEGVEERKDFRDHPLREPTVVETAKLPERGYGLTLVVPMTVWRPSSFERLADGLRAVDPDLHLVHPTASEGTLKDRIPGRPESGGDPGWCQEHPGACLEASEDPAFGTRIGTGARAPAEVVDEILTAVGDPSPLRLTNG